MKVQEEKSNQRIEFAHALRGLAALCVLIGHFTGVFWSSPSSVALLLNASALDINMPQYFLPLHFSTIFNFGSFGVAVFFLISGFVIPFSLSGLSRGGFLVARFFRIYPVYIVSISISLSIIWAMGMFISDKPFPFDFQHIVAQALLLRGWLWIPSIDGLSWTLEIEVVFYLISAVIVPMIIKSKLAGRYLIIYAILVSVLCIVGIENVNYMTGHYQTAVLYVTYALPFTIFMFSGTLFYFHMRKVITSAALILGGMTLFFGFSIGLAAHPALKVLATSSYLMALIIFSAFYFARDSFRSNWVLDNLANISYPLYASHAIAGYAVIYIMVSLGVAAWVTTGAGVFIALTLAVMLHRIVKVPAMKFGKKLGKDLYPKEKSI